MKQAMISIIIPVYNPPIEGFQKCMMSVLEQSYKKIEVIVIDDGSESSSAAQMDLWEQRDSRVKVIHQTNGGVGKARNRGIELAQGQYINFVDADDIVDGIWLEKAMGEAEQKEADIVYGRVHMINSFSETGYQIDRKTTDSVIYEHDDLWRVQDMLLMNNYSPFSDLPYLDFGPYGKLFKAEIVKSSPFPIGLPLAEDQVFNHVILKKVHRVIITDISAYYYVATNGSATHQYRYDAVETMLCAMNMIRSTLFEVPRVYNSFYYRLITETVLGIQLSCFHRDDNSHSLVQRMKLAHNALLLSPVKHAWKNIDLKQIPEGKAKFKLWLMKKRLFLLLELFWIAKFILNK